MKRAILCAKRVGLQPEAILAGLEMRISEYVDQSENATMPGRLEGAGGDHARRGVAMHR